MGVRTLQEYRDRLGATAAGALQRSNIGTPLIDEWVNDALREFGYAFKFHELEKNATWQTDVGVTGYGLVSVIGVDDFRFIEELHAVTLDQSAFSRVKPETRTRYKRDLGVFQDSNSWAIPKWYHRYSDGIYLRPIPDQVYLMQMDYHRIMPKLSLPADVSLFSEEWDEVIFVGALYRGFRHFGEFDRYQNVRNDFLGLVRSRQTEFELEEFPEGGISPIGPKDTVEAEENR